MDVAELVLSRLEQASAYGYHAGGETATEPAALAALALLAHRRDLAARAPIDWLLAGQQTDGSIGIDRAQVAPWWPTGWAILAWRAAANSSLANVRLPLAVERGCELLLRTSGGVMPQADRLGHDTTLHGWPWVDGTHSWIEPTAINVLALKHAGLADSPRVREAVRMLADRLLPTGGANYGNTFVLGQQLRPHVQPTGLSLLALAGEPDTDGRITRSIEYLNDALTQPTAAASLSYALLGLAAQAAYPQQATTWLAEAAERTLKRDAGAYPLALLALATLGTACPLMPSRGALAGRAAAPLPLESRGAKPAAPSPSPSAELKNHTPR